MVRGVGQASSQTNPRVDVACSDGLPVYRHAGASRLPETQRYKEGCAGVWIEFAYMSKPSRETYESLLAFAKTVHRDVEDLGPKDMIDIQSFLWVLGSNEYDED